MAGISQAHALITPTTRGFREAMKNEGKELQNYILRGRGAVKGGERKVCDLVVVLGYCVIYS